MEEKITQKRTDNPRGYLVCSPYRQKKASRKHAKQRSNATYHWRWHAYSPYQQSYR